MVRLNGLKIQNVRSIGDKPIMINFQDPVTIIQGNNGTGKTTMIEALNYVTTGALPSGKMQSFIHNNLIAQKNKVDAAVQLSFENVQGKKCTITKRMNATVKGVSTTTKSDEFSITLADENDEVRSINSKVTDCNREVLKHLGVTKAMLDNVIFCHQEDSNWPLSEPKQLKLKFDELFEVTKYVKAMEHIKKLQSEMKKKIELLDTELPYIQANMIAFQDKKKQIDGLTLEIDQINVNLSKKTSELNEQRASKINVEKERERVDQEEQKLGLMRQEVKLLDKQIESLSEVPDFLGGLDALIAQIKSLENMDESQDADVSKKLAEKKLSQISNQIFVKNNEIAKNQEEIIEFEVKEQRVNFAKNAKNEQERLILVELFNGIRTEAGVLEELRAYAKQLAIQSESEIQVAEEAINEVKRKLNDANVEIRSATDRSGLLCREIDAKDAQLKRHASELLDMQGKINLVAENEEKIKVLTGVVDDASSHKVDYAGLVEIKMTLGNVLSDLKETKKLKEVKAKAIADKHSILEPIENDLMQMLDGDIDEGLQGKLKAKLEMRENDLKNYERDMMALTKSSEGIDAEYINCQNWLLACRGNIQKQKDSMKKLSVSDVNVEEQLSSINVTLDKERREVGVLDGSKVVYDRWIEELPNKSCCPLCEKEIGTGREKLNLETKMKKCIEDLPRKMARLNTSISSNSKNQALLIESLPHSKAIKAAVNDELPKLIEREQAAKLAKEKNDALKKDLERKIRLLKSEIDRIRKLERDCLYIEQSEETIRRVEEQISVLVQKLVQTSFDDVCYDFQSQTDADATNDDHLIDTVNVEIQSLTDQIEVAKALEEQKNIALGELDDLKAENAAFQDRLVKRTQIEGTMKGLRVDMEELDKQYRVCMEVIPEIEAQIVEDSNILASYETSYKLLLDKTKNQSGVLAKHITSLENLDKEIAELGEVLFESSLKAKDKRTSLKKELELLQNSRNSLEVDMKTICSGQQKLKVAKDQMKKLLDVQKAGELRESLSQFAPTQFSASDLAKQEKEINKAIERLTGETSRLKCQAETMAKEISGLKRALNSDDYKNTKEKLKEKMLKKIVTKKTVDDLIKYRVVLDKTIISYHQTKMQEINSSVAELWKQVYQGNDIESIKIVSKVSSKETDKRKSYDYCVMMTIDGNDIEMRDRCSAGQKMLASILIRVALLEVFCSGFGVITLDEPTTSLDSCKIQNIADMLVDLVKFRCNGLPSEPKDDCCVEERDACEEAYQNSARKSRKPFSNFQLIVITHDNHLVELLHRAFKPELVFQLKKDPMGNTCLKSYNICLE
uniref:AAA_23 domain-containing protein n=1 Tax=Rhabditophanes sp. KR3021 TaxID=114890 RepID=A0AC35UA19_9BILA